MNIYAYTIHNDLTVDVGNDVNIADKGLPYIPVQFAVIDGDFLCGKNRLTSLKGAPRECKKFCCNDNQLTSLIGAPNKCAVFDCCGNRLTSLKYSPDSIDRFWCSNNRLVDLTGAPSKCNWLDCDSNKLTSLNGSPDECNNLWCNNNKLTSLNGMPVKCAYMDCRGNPMLADASALPDDCEMVCDYDVIAKNQALKQLDGIESEGSKVDDLRPKIGRIL